VRHIAVLNPVTVCCVCVRARARARVCVCGSNDALFNMCIDAKSGCLVCDNNRSQVYGTEVLR